MGLEDPGFVPVGEVETRHVVPSEYTHVSCLLAGAVVTLSTGVLIVTELLSIDRDFPLASIVDILFS